MDGLTWFGNVEHRGGRRTDSIKHYAALAMGVDGRHESDSVIKILVYGTSPHIFWVLADTHILHANGMSHYCVYLPLHCAIISHTTEGRRPV